MADTAIINRAERMNRAFVVGSVSGVAMDAAIAETMYLPVGFGHLWIEYAAVLLGTLSGAYVAVAPAYDGIELSIVSTDLSTRIDSIGVSRFVVRSTTTARPDLAVSFDLQNKVLLRPGERVFVTGPVLAGAGVTANMQLHLRGVRFQAG